MSRIVYMLLLLVCMTVGSPVESQSKQAENKPVSQSKERLRQDGEGGGEDPDLGGQVGGLLEGVVTGNFANILTGAAGFIPDEGTKDGISTILDALAPFLQTGFNTAVNRTKGFVGVTDPSAPKPTTPAAVAAQYIQVAGPGGAPVLLKLPPSIQQQVAVAAPAAATAAPTKPTAEDEDDDDETAKRLL